MVHLVLSSYRWSWPWDSCSHIYQIFIFDFNLVADHRQQKTRFFWISKSIINRCKTENTEIIARCQLPTRSWGVSSVATHTVIASMTIAGVFGMLRTIWFVLNTALSWSIVHPATIDKIKPLGRSGIELAIDSTFWGLTDSRVTSAPDIPSVIVRQLLTPYALVR